MDELERRAEIIADGGCAFRVESRHGVDDEITFETTPEQVVWVE